MTTPTHLQRNMAAIAATAITLLVACGGGGSTTTMSEPLSSVVQDVTPEPTVYGTDASRANTATTRTATEPLDSNESAPPTSAPAITPPPTTAVPLPTPALIPLDDEASEPVVPLGSIVIPAIGIDRPLFEGIRLPTFDLGPGHWPGTAMPGQLGNVVVGGHRTESHADFGDLDLLQPGDEVVFNEPSGASYTYSVVSTEIVDPFAAVIVNQTREYTATLFACHPKRSTDQRIVVRLALAT